MSTMKVNRIENTSTTDGGIDINTSGNVGIGTSSPTNLLHVNSSIAGATIHVTNSTSGSSSSDGLIINQDGNDTYIWNKENSIMSLGTNNTERMRIDSSGNVGIGTSSPSKRLHTVGGDVRFDGAGGANTGILQIEPGSSPSDGATLTATYTGSGSYGPLKIITGASERMRIASNGFVMFGKTTGGNNVSGFTFVPGDAEYSSFVNNTSDTGARVMLINRQGGGVGGRYIEFRYANGFCGSITANSSTSVAYNTSSDYRLKENVVDIADGITRVKQLAPKRFNFIADSDTTVDGFLAHEAQTVVPEAITGTKDEVDDDGNAVMQGIDQSKLVPLLTAALQEAIAKIETLEQRLSDAGIA